MRSEPSGSLLTSVFGRRHNDMSMVLSSLIFDSVQIRSDPIEVNRIEPCSKSLIRSEKFHLREALHCTLHWAH